MPAALPRRARGGVQASSAASRVETAWTRGTASAPRAQTSWWVEVSLPKSSASATSGRGGSNRLRQVLRMIASTSRRGSDARYEGMPISVFPAIHLVHRFR